MIQKCLAVVVILLFIGVAFAQSINAKDIEIKDDTTEPLGIGRTIVRGFGLFPIFGEDNVTFLAIRLHLKIITNTTRTVETYWFQWITLPLKDFFYYSPGRLDIIMFYIAKIKGDFEPQYSRLGMNNLMVR